MKKILILTANPKNTDRLRLDEELREIQAGLERAKKREQFEIITRWAVRKERSASYSLGLRSLLLSIFLGTDLAIKAWH